MILGKHFSFFFVLLFFWACQSNSGDSSAAASGDSSEKKIVSTTAKSGLSTSPKANTSQNPILEKAELPVLPKEQKLAAGKLLPYDQGQLLPDFQRFRSELLAAVNRKDAGFVQQIVAENIKFSFGGENGRAAFLETWQLDKPDSPFWQELKKILLLGGTMDRNTKNTFIVPYIDGAWPAELDVFEYGVITGEQVRIRKSPGLDGEIIGALSYDVIRYGQRTGEEKTETIGGETWPWIPIRMPDNSGMGYVYGKYIHSPVDYRAYFERTDGKWKMGIFIAGD